MKNFGAERAARISPAGAALERDIPFTFHQDTPVLPPDMLETVWCGVNRLTRSGAVLGPEQKIPVVEALAAVTIRAAWQYFEEGGEGQPAGGEAGGPGAAGAGPAHCGPHEPAGHPRAGHLEGWTADLPPGGLKPWGRKIKKEVPDYYENHLAGTAAQQRHRGFDHHGAGGGAGGVARPVCAADVHPAGGGPADLRPCVYPGLAGPQAGGGGISAFTLIPGVVLSGLGIWLMTGSDSVIALVQYVFGAVVIFHGVLDVQSSVSLMRQGAARWWLDLALSALTLALGALILINPFGTFAALVTLIGLVLIYDGLSDLWIIHRLSRMVRDLERDLNGDIIETRGRDLDE